MMIATKLLIQDKITDAINCVDSISVCGNIARMIDEYELSCPDDTRFIHETRNTLCDKTFAVYKISHKMNSGS